jgi:hypothetical protein
VILGRRESVQRHSPTARPKAFTVARAAFPRGRANRVSQATLATASADLARIWRKGMAGDTDFTPDEFAQWLLVCRASLQSGEDSFLQHKAGLLDQSAFDSYEAGARSFLGRLAFARRGS